MSLEMFQSLEVSVAHRKRTLENPCWFCYRRGSEADPRHKRGLRYSLELRVDLRYIE
jgi:hypothetical protein